MTEKTTTETEQKPVATKPLNQREEKALRGLVDMHRARVQSDIETAALQWHTQATKELDARRDELAELAKTDEIRTLVSEAQTTIAGLLAEQKSTVAAIRQEAEQRVAEVERAAEVLREEAMAQLVEELADKGLVLDNDDVHRFPSRLPKVLVAGYDAAKNELDRKKRLMTQQAQSDLNQMMSRADEQILLAILSADTDARALLPQIAGVADAMRTKLLEIEAPKIGREAVVVTKSNGEQVVSDGAYSA